MIFILAFSPLTSAHSYEWTLKTMPTHISFFVQTEELSSMCPLQLISLDVQPGVLNLNIQRDPTGICLCAFGPCKGRFALDKSLFSEGDYEVRINERSCGVFHYP